MTPPTYPTKDEAAECATRWLWWWYQTHRRECPNDSALARKLDKSPRNFVSQLFRSKGRGLGFKKLLVVWKVVGGSLDSLVRTPPPPLPEGAEPFPVEASTEAPASKPKRRAGAPPRVLIRVDFRSGRRTPHPGPKQEP